MVTRAILGNIPSTCFHLILTVEHGSAPTASHGGIGDWINLEAIQLLTHHTSAVVAAVVLFWFVGFVVQHLMHEGALKRCVLLVDEFVLLGLFIYFAYQLFMYL
jgi:hypothetical protein